MRIRRRDRLVVMSAVIQTEALLARIQARQEGSRGKEPPICRKPSPFVTARRGTPATGCIPPDWLMIPARGGLKAGLWLGGV